LAPWRSWTAYVLLPRVHAPTVTTAMYPWCSWVEPLKRKCPARQHTAWLLDLLCSKAATGLGMCVLSIRWVEVSIGAGILADTMHIFRELGAALERRLAQLLRVIHHTAACRTAGAGSTQVFRSRSSAMGGAGGHERPPPPTPACLPHCVGPRLTVMDVMVCDGTDERVFRRTIRYRRRGAEDGGVHR
jgi:hypothetical protein